MYSDTTFTPYTIPGPSLNQNLYLSSHNLNWQQWLYLSIRFSVLWTECHNKNLGMDLYVDRSCCTEEPVDSGYSDGLPKENCTVSHCSDGFHKESCTVSSTVSNCSEVCHKENSMSSKERCNLKWNENQHCVSWRLHVGTGFLPSFLTTSFPSKNSQDKFGFFRFKT